MPVRKSKAFMELPLPKAAGDGVVSSGSSPLARVCGHQHADRQGHHHCLVQDAARRTRGGERETALAPEAATFAVLSMASRTLHAGASLWARPGTVGRVRRA
jgi:hypothetical protein